MGDSRRIAAVTGASRNIGRAIALGLASQGHDVGCLGRDRDAVEETVELIEAAGGVASAHVGDVTTNGVPERFLAEVADRYGGLDVLVNNAGVMRELAAADQTVEDFRAVVEVNLVGYFATARAAHPHLRERPEAVIVNVGSIFGALGVAGAVSYCASKAAVEGLTRALGVEWARDDIRVVCIAPGYVESEISRGALTDEQVGAQILRRIPQRRIAQASEIADAVCFLADPRSAYVTATTLVIDGGQVPAI